MIKKRKHRQVKNLVLREIIEEVKAEKKTRCSFPFWNNWSNWANWSNWSNWYNWNNWGNWANY